MTVVLDKFKVELPAGGRMSLMTAEEVELWNQSHDRYVEDYQLNKTNDLVLLGAILQQQVELFRAQLALNGVEPELDASKVPTGNYVQKELDGDGRDKWNKRLNTASAEILKIEGALGIDKKTRESGSQFTIASYITNLKEAAHARGIHIVERTLAYEKFVMALRTKVRMLHNLDDEDKAYHNLNPDSVIEWADGELKALEQVDKDFANQTGKIYVGKLK